MRVLWAKMSSFLSRLLPFYPQRQVKKFTKAHRRALEEFADLKISLEELRQRLVVVFLRERKQGASHSALSSRGRLQQEVCE
jgi:hypothetical protein